MFRSFKTKLAYVKNDVTAGIKTVGNGIGAKLSSVTNIGDSSDDHAPIHNLVSPEQPSSQSSEPGTNVDAAQNLLHRYEVTWEDLYNQSEGNLQNAKRVASQLQSTHNSMSLVDKKIGLFEAEVRELPAVISSVQQLTGQIVELHSQCSLLEDALAVLESLCDRADVHLAKMKEEEKLAAYRADKQRLLAVCSETLAAEHKKKLISLEMREAEVRREKELFYQKAFEDDLRRFKAEQSLTDLRKSLEEVTIEPDRHEVMELEQFLSGAKPDRPAENSDVESAVSDSQPASSTTDQPTAEAEVNDHEGGRTHRTDSNSSLEWDYREDDLNISIAKQLESSLEMEINGILQNSRAGLEPTTSDNVAETCEQLLVDGSG